MSNSLEIVFLIVLAAALAAQSGCDAQAQAQREEAAQQPGEQPAQQPPEVRPPDVGPRIDAMRGWYDLAGMGIRIKDVYVSRGYDDDVVRWGNVPTDMWMKVDLEYRYLTKEVDATYYLWNTSTAAASAIYDDADRKSAGANGHSTYNKEQTQQWLKEGMVRPTEETIYFNRATSAARATTTWTWLPIIYRRARSTSSGFQTS